jgi:hypothetical protein
MLADDQLIRYYGVYTLPYATVYPELEKQLRQLYETRVAQVPWLPKSWRSTIMSNVHGREGKIAVIAPSTANYNGGRGAEFLDTPEKKIWWDELAASTSKAITAYGAKKAAEGRIEIQDAENDIAFWNSAIKLTQFAAAPVSIVQQSAEVYDKTKWLVNPTIMIGAAAIGAYLLFNKLR